MLEQLKEVYKDVKKLKDVVILLENNFKKQIIQSIINSIDENLYESIYVLENETGETDWDW